MFRAPVTQQDVQHAWLEMPRCFRDLHPLPQEQTWEAGQAWATKVRRDCASVVEPLLQSVKADLASGQVAEAECVLNEARPFQRLMQTLEAVQVQQGMKA